MPVSFYEGDPTGGGTLLGTVETTQFLEPGEFEEVTLLLPADTKTAEAIWVVADDQGGLTGLTNECDETNNAHNSGLILSPSIPCDVDGNGVIDVNDINAIFAARGEAADPDDPRDADGDGVITVNDGRACVLQCTNPQCAPWKNLTTLSFWLSIEKTMQQIDG